eukprot:2245-Pyramimonas_sp.AAC.1
MSYHTTPYVPHHTIPYHTIPHISCPCHPSREAKARRVSAHHSILRLRAPPTPPGRPRQSEEGIGIPYYLP